MNGADQQQPAAFATRASSSPDFTVAATTAADLLAIERSLNEGLRKELAICERENNAATMLALQTASEATGLRAELKQTNRVLSAAVAMLTPEQQASLIMGMQVTAP